MTRNSKLGQARQLGKDAFLAGKIRVPAKDGKVLELLEGEPVGGDCLPILKKWLAGWDKANLAKKENHEHVYICECGKKLETKR